MSARRVSWGVVLLAALGPARGASGQTVDIARPRTLTVGRPSGGARTDRLDGGRSGCSRTDLPTSGLRTEWRTPLGTLVQRAPLVDGAGTTYVVGTRGEVVAIARDGAERWRVSTGSSAPGPAAMLADDAFVFVDGAGDAIAVRDGAIRWRIHVGRGDATRPAPLALDDGGVVVATMYELVALDADGHERARATLPEATGLPLVSALGKVTAVTVSGAVWSWTPGAAEPRRVATFGSPVDGAAALADDHTLVAVSAGQIHLTAVDLLRGVATTRAVAPAGVWLGPPAMQGPTAHLLLLTATSELAVGVDSSGNEVGRTLLAQHSPVLAPDGGVAALIATAHTSPLVDLHGTFAFATAEGAIGVASAKSVELLGEACESPLGAAARAAPPVVGFAPLEKGAMVAVCYAGAVLAIAGRKSGP
jgi:PQQ-like domain